MSENIRFKKNLIETNDQQAEIVYQLRIGSATTDTTALSSVISSILLAAKHQDGEFGFEFDVYDSQGTNDAYLNYLTRYNATQTVKSLNIVTIKDTETEAPSVILNANEIRFDTFSTGTAVGGGITSLEYVSSQSISTGSISSVTSYFANVTAAAVSTIGISTNTLTTGQITNTQFADIISVSTANISSGTAIFGSVKISTLAGFSPITITDSVIFNSTIYARSSIETGSIKTDNLVFDVASFKNLTILSSLGFSDAKLTYNQSNLFITGVQNVNVSGYALPRYIGAFASDPSGTFYNGDMYYNNSISTKKIFLNSAWATTGEMTDPGNFLTISSGVGITGIIGANAVSTLQISSGIARFGDTIGSDISTLVLSSDISILGNTITGQLQTFYISTTTISSGIARIGDTITSQIQTSGVSTLSLSSGTSILGNTTSEVMKPNGISTITVSSGTAIIGDTTVERIRAVNISTSVFSSGTTTLGSVTASDISSITISSGTAILGVTTTQLFINTTLSTLTISSGTSIIGDTTSGLTTATAISTLSISSGLTILGETTTTGLSTLALSTGNTSLGNTTTGVVTANGASTLSVSSGTAILGDITTSHLTTTGVSTLTISSGTAILGDTTSGLLTATALSTTTLSSGTSIFGETTLGLVTAAGISTTTISSGLAIVGGTTAGGVTATGISTLTISSGTSMFGATITNSLSTLTISSGTSIMGGTTTGLITAKGLSTTTFSSGTSIFGGTTTGLITASGVSTTTISSGVAILGGTAISIVTASGTSSISVSSGTSIFGATVAHAGLSSLTLSSGITILDTTTTASISTVSISSGSIINPTIFRVSAISTLTVSSGTTILGGTTSQRVTATDISTTTLSSGTSIFRDTFARGGLSTLTISSGTSILGATTVRNLSTVTISTGSITAGTFSITTISTFQLSTGAASIGFANVSTLEGFSPINVRDALITNSTILASTIVTNLVNVSSIGSGPSVPQVGIDKLITNEGNTGKLLFGSTTSPLKYYSLATDTNIAYNTTFQDATATNGTIFPTSSFSTSFTANAMTFNSSNGPINLGNYANFVYRTKNFNSITQVRKYPSVFDSGYIMNFNGYKLETVGDSWAAIGRSTILYDPSSNVLFQSSGYYLSPTWTIGLYRTSNFFALYTFDTSTISMFYSTTTTPAYTNFSNSIQFLPYYVIPFIILYSVDEYTTSSRDYMSTLNQISQLNTSTLKTNTARFSTISMISTVNMIGNTMIGTTTPPSTLLELNNTSIGVVTVGNANRWNESLSFTGIGRGWSLGVETTAGSCNALGFFDYNTSTLIPGTTVRYIRGWLLGGNGGSNRQMNFTGQHRCVIQNESISTLQSKIGFIVCSDKNTYIDMSSGSTIRGKGAISIDEALPVVTIAATENDKTSFGVLSYTEDPESRTFEAGGFVTPYTKELGDNRVFVNALGEGAIWVTNKNGVLEAGDYITSSRIPGYGQKQHDDKLHNYTVAKVTMDCDFTAPLQSTYDILVSSYIFSTYYTSSCIAYISSYFSTPVYSTIFSTITTSTIQSSFQSTFNSSVNVLDANGNLLWVPAIDSNGIPIMETAYSTRYVNEEGFMLSKEEYDTYISSFSTAYIAAFVGCTYHSG